MLDRDISQRTWNGYLKKYEKDFVLFTDEIGITSIKLKKSLGFVQPFSLVNKQLHAILSFRSSRHKSGFLNNPIRKALIAPRITQESSQGVCIRFDEKDINLYSKLLLFYKRKNLSKDQRKRIADRFKGSKPNVEVC